MSLSYHRPAVKSNRHTLRPPLPFGAGLIEDDEWPDQPWDQLAAEAELEARWEAAMMNESRCAACGLITDDLTASLCDRCALAIDADLDIETGGICDGCKRAVDYLEPSGLCCPCDIHQSDMAHSGNQGY